MKFSFINQINLTETNDNNNTSWTQIMKTGEFEHPSYGQIIITPQTIQKLKENFDNNTRQIDLSVDYDHQSGLAAGWVKKLQIEDNTLWALIEWTKDGTEKITDNLYRYISPEFTFNYLNPETKQDHGPTLLGIALTNRPFLKGMTAVNLSEFNQEEVIEINKQDTVALTEFNQLKQELTQTLEKIQLEQEKNLQLTEQINQLQEEQAKKQDALFIENLANNGKLLPRQKQDAFMLLTETRKTCNKNSTLYHKLQQFITDLPKVIDLTEQGTNQTTDHQPELKLIEDANKLAHEKNISIGKATAILCQERGIVRG